MALTMPTTAWRRTLAKASSVTPSRKKSSITPWIAASTWAWSVPASPLQPIQIMPASSIPQELAEIACTSLRRSRNSFQSRELCPAPKIPAIKSSESDSGLKMPGVRQSTTPRAVETSRCNTRLRETAGEGSAVTRRTSVERRVKRPNQRSTNPTTVSEGQELAIEMTMLSVV